MTARRDFAKKDGRIRSAVCFVVWLLALAMIGTVAVIELIRRRMTR